MAGLVDDDDRHVGRDSVQVVAVGRSLFLQLGLIVAEAHDQVDRLHGLCIVFGPGFQRLLDACNISHRAVGRGQQVGRKRLQATHDYVAVAVHETRQQRPALQIENVRRISPMRHDLRERPDLEDHALPDRDTLGPRQRVVHAEDGPARINCVCILPGTGDTRNQH
jgi:hypothetical protein